MQQEMASMQQEVVYMHEKQQQMAQKALEQEAGAFEVRAFSVPCCSCRWLLALVSDRMLLHTARPLLRCPESRLLSSASQGPLLSVVQNDV